jgi:integrase
MRTKLTAKNVNFLQLSAGKNDDIIWDTELSGFGVRIRRGGSRSYVAQYAIGPRTRRMTLSTTAAMDFGRAKAEARNVLAAVRLGRDPQGEKEQARFRAGETIGHYVPKFLERQRQRVARKTATDTDRYLTRYCRSWHGRPIWDGVDRRAVAALITEATEERGARTANAVLAALSTFFNWAIAEGLTDSNPTAYVNKAIEAGPRTRVLSELELAAIWAATDIGSDYDTIVRLLILSGARRDEVGALKWSEYDADTGTVLIPGERTKNGRDHEIPLPGFARTILEARPRRQERDHVFGRTGTDRGFSGWSKAKIELDARLKEAGNDFAPFTIHDLRRSNATHMAEIGIEPHVIEAILNHISGHKAGVAGIYNHASYTTAKAAALQRWSDHIERLVTGSEPARVVELRRPRR